MDRVGEKEPIIILGMHRSGTSLITRMLQSTGLFIGLEVQQDYEAIFYLNFNDELLRLRGGSWDHPENLLPWNKDLVDQSRQLFKRYIKSKTFRHFYIPESENPPRQWGWKDPRNTLNWPFWIEQYPNAKFVHIYRNPVDVGLSLRNRVIRSLDSRLKWKRRWGKLLNLHQRIGKLKRIKHQGNQKDLLDLERGLEIWLSYMHSVDQLKENCKPEMFYELKYEDFLQNPDHMFLDLMEFCGLENKNDFVASNEVNASRRYAFLNNDLGSQFYQRIRNHPTMKVYGYDQIAPEVQI